MSTDRSTMATSALAPWPIRLSQQPKLPLPEKKHAMRVAEQKLSAEPALRAKWFRRKGVFAGWAPGPTLYLEDHRSIALATEEWSRPFEYRALGLADSGDFYVVSPERNRRFEAYMRDHVGLGAPTILEAKFPQGTKYKRLGAACLSNEAIKTKLFNAARSSNGINIAPFISTGDVWTLGRAIAEATKKSVRIVGAPPALANKANDKLWFADFVRELLGPSALPPTEHVYSLTYAAAKIRKLAKKTEQVVVKVPSSAGSMGNIVFRSSLVRNMNITGIRGELADKLAASGWSEQFPILLGIWEQNVISSPSVQMWVPTIEQGNPIIEEFFVQALVGDGGGFVGAEIAKLPTPITEKLALGAMKIAVALQHMGYFGRLSLDTVLIESDANASIHWIEANARWGGVSIPMTVANKIGGEREPLQLLIVQKSLKNLRCPNIQTLSARLEESFISIHKETREGMIFLLPTDGSHLAFAIVGLPPSRANALAKSVIDECQISTT